MHLIIHLFLEVEEASLVNIVNVISGVLLEELGQEGVLGIHGFWHDSFDLSIPFLLLNWLSHPLLHLNSRYPSSAGSSWALAWRMGPEMGISQASLIQACRASSTSSKSALFILLFWGPKPWSYRLSCSHQPSWARWRGYWGVHPSPCQSESWSWVPYPPPRWPSTLSRECWFCIW